MNWIHGMDDWMGNEVISVYYSSRFDVINRCGVVYTTNLGVVYNVL